VGFTLGVIGASQPLDKNEVPEFILAVVAVPIAHGLLAAIGHIGVLGQFPRLLNVDVFSKEEEEEEGFEPSSPQPQHYPLH